jgi:hypothetical protein
MDNEDNVVAYIYSALSTPGYTSAAGTIDLKEMFGMRSSKPLSPPGFGSLRASEALSDGGPRDIFNRRSTVLLNISPTSTALLTTSLRLALA